VMSAAQLAWLGQRLNRGLFRRMRQEPARLARVRQLERARIGFGKLAGILPELPASDATARGPSEQIGAAYDYGDRRILLVNRTTSSRSQLHLVIAHELTHVQNRDVLVMTIAGFFATVAAYIVQFGFFFGGGDGGDDDGDSFVILLLVSLAVYAISFFLMQALSRYREFAADRGSGIITGRPSALASALLKISGTMDRIPQKDLRATSELAAFYIFPPKAKAAVGNLFSTHPPMEKRIAALERLEAQLQGVPA